MIIGSNLFSRLERLSGQTSAIANELAEASEIATTGVKISSPSDAPELVSRIDALTTAIGDSQQYAASAQTAENLLSVADSALSDLAGVLSAAQELAVQLGSETYDSSMRTASADTAAGYLEQALTLVNTDVAGRALFAGTAYDGDAFDASLSYVGSADPSTLTVSEEAEVIVGFDGEALGLGDALTALSELQDALAANDVERVQATMDTLSAAITTVSQAQTSIGAEQLSAGDHANFAASMELELTTQLSSIQDADAIEALVRVNSLQTLYQTALTVTSSSNLGSLFDRI